MRKHEKDDVDYSLGMKREHCGNCEYYNNYACSKVVGRIDPRMWCDLWVLDYISRDD